VDLTKWGIGVLFVGEEGQLVADYGKRVLLPKEKYADFREPEPWIAPSPGHHKEWILGCKTGSPTLCNFDLPFGSCSLEPAGDDPLRGNQAGID
jgi:hypothetical protein